MEGEKDTVQPGSSQDGTPGNTGKVYTEAEVQKMVSDAASQAGFKAVESIKAEKQAEIEQLRKIIDDRETADALAKIDQTDPKQVHSFTQGQTIKELKAALAQKELEVEQLTPKAQKADEYERKEKSLADAIEIANQYENVSSGELMSLTDGSKEKMEALAKKIGTPKEKTPVTTPDSSITSGSLGALTNDAAENMDMETFKQRRIQEGAPYRE